MGGSQGRSMGLHNMSLGYKRRKSTMCWGLYMGRRRFALKDYTHTIEGMRVPKRRITRGYACKNTNHYRRTAHDKHTTHTAFSILNYHLGYTNFFLFVYKRHETDFAKIGQEFWECIYKREKTGRRGAWEVLGYQLFIEGR